MKKTLKFAWMILFCLPGLVFTACSDDENGDLGKDEIALFKDYSPLLGKKSEDVIKWVGIDPFEQTEEADWFEVKADNVDFVEADYSIAEGIVNEKCQNVFSYLSDNLSTTAITNYLARIYNFDEVDDEGYYFYTYKDLVIMYFIDEDLGNVVTYTNKKNYQTRGADFKAAIKAEIKERMKESAKVIRK